MNNPIDIENAAAPKILRVFAAIFYDLWLIAALWLLGSTVDAMLSKALTGDPGYTPPWAMSLWLAVSPMLYLIWFWTHGGQTTGMRAWRIRVLTEDGNPITYQQGLIRCLAALISWLAIGLGYIWILFDSKSRSWHDSLSGTRLVMLAKEK